MKSTQDLLSLTEVFAVEDDGSHKFSYSTFAIRNRDYYVWFGQAPIRKKDLSSKDFMESLKFVPDRYLYLISFDTMVVSSNGVGLLALF